MPDTVKLHYKDGTTTEMDSVDARRALLEHPSEWSTEPFPKETQKSESEKTKKAEAQAEAVRAAEAKKLKDEQEAEARKRQAEADVEAERIAKEQEEKKKADDEAREKQAGAAPITKPITNDGLKVGHIPSEVPALEPQVYVAEHRGRGSYSILDNTGAEVIEKISKEDAEAFNAMTDAEKAEYVKAETAKG